MNVRIKCRFGIHERITDKQALTVGKVRKTIKCKHCNKIFMSIISQDMATWKKLKENRKPKTIKESKSLDEKIYTFRGVIIDDTPPCLYMVYEKMRNGNKKLIMELQTNGEEVDKFHKFRNVRTLDGKEIGSVFVQGLALSDESDPNAKLIIEEGEHYD